MRDFGMQVQPNISVRSPWFRTFVFIFTITVTSFVVLAAAFDDEMGDTGCGGG